MEESRFRQQLEARNKSGKKAEKRHGGKDWPRKAPCNLFFSDDPYYCGLRARIPNFAKSKAQKEKEAKYGRIGERRIDKEGHPMVWHGPQRGYHPDGEPLPPHLVTRRVSKCRECVSDQNLKFTHFLLVLGYFHPFYADFWHIFVKYLAQNYQHCNLAAPPPHQRK